MNEHEMTVAELAKALRCCGTNSNQGGGCRSCPMKPQREGLECGEKLLLAAAQRLEGLRDAMARYKEQETGELIRLAGACSTALERGLIGANEELFSRMLEHQSSLRELGWESVIRAEPVGEKGWSIKGVSVGGVTVYGELEERSHGGA